MKNDSSRFGHIIQLFTVLLTAILISLALELAPFGIRVNVVCPSGTETPAFIKDMSRTGNYEAEVARLISSYPLKRLGQPIDMAYAVAFFASEESSFITGTHLMVDGGYTAQ